VHRSFMAEAGSKPHPWTWLQWVFLAVFVALWIPSFFDASLAWMWFGFTGLLSFAIGLIEIVAPAWFIASRRRFLATAPAWQRRIGDAFDSLGEPGPRGVRIIGVVMTFLGAALVAGAAVLALGG
jgi:hypothetical protein